MKISKSFTGFCPVQGKNETISIDYIENSDLSSGHKYEKGMSECPFASYGNNCNIKCPIAKTAPDLI